MKHDVLRVLALDPRAPLFWSFSFVLFALACLLPMHVLLAPGMDKLVHMGGFFALGVWPVLLHSQRKYVLGALLGLALAGAGIEILQSFMPGRTPSLTDMLANITGLALAWLVVKTLKLTAQP
jgi:VanZ family protein